MTLKEEILSFNDQSDIRQGYKFKERLDMLNILDGNNKEILELAEIKGII